MFRRAVNSRREVGSRDYSGSIVTNSRYDSDSIGNNRSSLYLNSFYLRNMVDLVVDLVH